LDFGLACGLIWLLVWFGFWLGWVWLFFLNKSLYENIAERG
jgi:hypothetical protein